MAILATVPFRSTSLTNFGLVFFVLNLLLFALICVSITIRFVLRPGSFIASFTDQLESLFIPSFVSIEKSFEHSHTLTFPQVVS